MSKGALLVDGALQRDALVWLSHTYSEHSLSPLLSGTPYEALADVGPILLEADEGSRLHTDWLRGSTMLESAVWLKTEVGQGRLYELLRRRLKIQSPDGREYWLRLADARPLVNAWHADAVWPDGFWHGIHEIWARYKGNACRIWKNPLPTNDCRDLDDGTAATFTLDWPLLEALACNHEAAQEAAL